MYISAIVDGHSMLPTLKDTDWVLLDTSKKRRDAIKKDDIVNFWIFDGMFSKRKKYCIKRVAAVAGDVVKDANGTRKVPAGHVYVIGDNKNNSYDSRHFGFVPVKCIKGVMVGVADGKKSKLLKTGVASDFKSAYRECRSVIYKKWGID